MTTTIRFLILNIGILILSGCQTVYDTLETFDHTALPLINQDTSSRVLSSDNCPAAEIAAELGTAIAFTQAQQPSLDTITSRLDMDNIQARCTFKDNTMRVDLDLSFAGHLDPQASSVQTAMPYPFFVAIVSPVGDVVTKEVFSAAVSYDNTAGTAAHHETIRQIIPVNSPGHGARYKIMTGFQLTPEQLAFNRYLIETYAQPESGS